MEEDPEQEHPVRNVVLSVCDLKQHGEGPSQRCGAQTVTIDTRMYLFGGADDKAVHGDLHLLEIQAMKWSTLATEGQKPSPRFGHTMDIYGADLVVFGGLASEQAGLLEDAGRAALTPPFIAGATWNHTCSPENSLFMLNTQSLTWQVPQCAGTPPSPRCYHAARVVGSTFVVFGGCASADFTQPLNDLHLFDLRSMQWTSPACAGTPPSPRYGHGMIQGPDDQVFVFGGALGHVLPEGEAGTLYSFKISTSTWSVVNIAGTPPIERAFHSFDLVGKWAFVFGGCAAANASCDFYALDISNQRWVRPLYEGSVNVRAHAAAVLQDKLMVFGGVRDSSKKEAETRISKKLFFMNVLEVRTGGVGEGDFKFKLVTVGDSGVGKSCLLTRFVQDVYSDFHVSTIGVDFKNVVTMVKGKLVKLQLWDTAGQERFSVVTGNYYRNSDGFIFVFDATSRASFDHVEQWLGQVQQHHDCGPSTIKILIGNKYDMAGEVVISEEEGRAKAQSIGASFVAASAKTASNVDVAFLTAAQDLVEARRKPAPAAGGAARPANSGNVSLGAPPARTSEKKSGCGCG